MKNTSEQASIFRNTLANHSCFGLPIEFYFAGDEELLSAEELNLIERISAHLPALIPLVEKEILAYDPESDYREHFSEPFISMDPGDEPSSLQKWRFVVCRDDHPDWQWYVMFQGLEYHEMYAAT